MKRILTALAIVLVLAAVIVGVYVIRGYYHRVGTRPEPAATVSAVCPVMGTAIADVNKAAGKSVYKGKAYYFCCPGCKPEFDKNPEKYVAR